MKKISFLSSLILLLFVSSCTSDDMPNDETKKPQIQQQKALSPEEINT